MSEVLRVVCSRYRQLACLCSVVALGQHCVDQRPICATPHSRDTQYIHYHQLAISQLNYGHTHGGFERSCIGVPALGARDLIAAAHILASDHLCPVAVVQCNRCSSSPRTTAYIPAKHPGSSDGGNHLASTPPRMERPSTDQPINGDMYL